MIATGNAVRVLALGAALLWGAASAQTYPSKPIRIIEPVVSGAPGDVAMRRMVPGLGALLGQPVIVDNRPGANSAIGAREVARAAADGYTVLHGYVGNALNDALEPNSGARFNHELLPVTLLLTTPLVMVVHPSLQVATLKDYIALAKSKPREITYASAGMPSLPRLLAERIQQSSGISTFEVTYKSFGAEMPDLLAGHVKTAYVSPLSIVQHLRAGRLRGLAVAGSRRMSMIPEVPTMAEAGLPGVEGTAWSGLFVPAGTPSPVVSRLQQAFARVLALPEIRSEIERLGQEVGGNSSEEFSAFVRAEVAKWTQVIKQAGMNKAD